MISGGDRREIRSDQARLDPSRSEFDPEDRSTLCDCVPSGREVTHFHGMGHRPPCGSVRNTTMLAFDKDFV
jgi:hypothetical protein